MKHSFGNYLSKLPAHLPVHTDRELIEFNRKYEEKALKNGQNMLEFREKKPNTLKNPEYLIANLEDLYFSQELGIDYALKKYTLDAILFPAYIGSIISAKAGYPSIAIPAGYMENGRPFDGAAFSEGVLIKLAYSFEKATKHGKSWEFSSIKEYQISDFNKVIRKSNKIGAPFMVILRCQKWQLDKKRSVSLVNNKFTLRYSDGEIVSRTLTSIVEIEKVISDEFLLPKLPVADAINILKQLNVDIFANK